MKTSIMMKLGISMLVMLMTVGTVSASSYSNAEDIDVPYGSFWIWDGETASDDWYQFYANNGEDIYIDVQLTFAEDGGEMKLHDSGENGSCAKLRDLICFCHSSSPLLVLIPSNTLKIYL